MVPALILASCNAPVQNQTQAPVAREVLTVSESAIELTEVYPASIQGRQDVDIYPQVSGKIEKLCVKEGDVVKAGQALFVIDQVPFEAALRVAKANVQAAEARLQSARLEADSKRALRDAEVVSEYDLSLSLNALAQAQAALEQARAEQVNASNSLSYTVVKSPVNGVVGTLPFRAGTLVSPSMPQALTTVSDNSEMYVYFAMTESAARSLVREYGSSQAAIAAMPEVSLRLSDGSMYEHKGKVESVSGILSPSTGTVPVRCVFPNAEKLLYSGSTGSVMVSRNVENAIVVPQSAIYEIQGVYFASKVVDGKVSTAQVTISGARDGKEYVVSSGLEPGDVIVAAGAGLVHDGDQIVL